MIPRVPLYICSYVFYQWVKCTACCCVSNFYYHFTGESPTSEVTSSYHFTGESPTSEVTSSYHFTGESPTSDGRQDGDIHGTSPTSDGRHDEDIHGTSPSPGSGKLQPHSRLSWGHENLGMSPVSCISSYT